MDRLAGEEGWTRKVWGESLAVCLAYPNLYRTGMSNLGFQAVYALINRRIELNLEIKRLDTELAEAIKKWSK